MYQVENDAYQPNRTNSNLETQKGIPMDNNEVKKILLIEDNEKYLKEWKESLERAGFFVMCADTIEEAWQVFPTHKWDAIVFDGCLGGDVYNAGPLIMQFQDKVSPECILLAASSCEELRTMMVCAGCTRETEKLKVPGLLRVLLS